MSPYTPLMIRWLFITLTVMAVQKVGSQALTNIYASGCTGQELQLSCPMHHKVAIKRVFYGVKQEWGCRGIMDQYKGPGTINTIHTIQSTNGNTSEDCCRVSHNDCMVNDDSKYPSLNTRCSGYKNCTIRVEKVKTRRRSCDHRQFTDYMTIMYDCIPLGDVVYFCSNDKKRGKALYLSNREYPRAIQPTNEQTDCKCMIRTSNSKGISIHSVDVLLAWSERGSRECRRSLRIQDPMDYDDHIKCAHRGFYGFRTIYSRPVGNVTVTLSSKPGEGMAFIWLQVKGSDSNGDVEVLCGKPLQALLDEIEEKKNRGRINEEMERRRKEEEEEKRKKELDKGQNRVDGNADTNAGDEEGTQRNSSTIGSGATKHSGDGLEHDLIPIIAGIVAAGFILIVIVIITIACYCRRIRREKKQNPKPLELYPAVTSEPLDLSSYCKYDYDDEHLCTISRAPMKMVSRLDEGVVANNRRPNGFISVATTEEYQIHKDPPPSPPLPAGISTPPPSLQSQPLLDGQGGCSYREVHYPGDLSLRFVKPIVHNGNGPEPYNDGDFNDLTIETHHQGHTTLPSNRKAVLIHSGPKSPLGKRSKSVTFSQPVAMVPPMNSESEESVEEKSYNVNNAPSKEDYLSEQPSYDNLQSMDISDKPFVPGKPEFIKIPRWERDPKEDSPPRPFSTFHNSPSDELKIVYAPSNDPNLSPDAKVHPYTRDPRLTPDSDDTAYMSDRDSNSTSSSLWSPTRKSGKPVVMPKPQKAELFESGV